jgi:ribosomal protein L19
MLIKTFYIQSDMDFIVISEIKVIKNLQAKKMIKTSNRKLKCIDVGNTVRIPIPDVDKVRGSSRKFIGYCHRYSR